MANVLFAAPIDHVLTEFDLTGATVGEPVGEIPLPVPFEIPRPQQLRRVINALLTKLPQPSAGDRLVGLVGMGGSGKSTLAAAAARDPKVRDAFPDGRFWLELGPHPPLLQLQARLVAALGDSTPITDTLQGRARLSRLLGERKYLLVLDNVWDKTDLSAFAAIGPMGRLLATTRDAATLPGNTGILLDELDPAAATQLLADWTATPAEQLPAEAGQVAQECGYLPLALALCGAMIAAGGHSWRQLLDLLHQADFEALHSHLVGYPHRSLAVALGASIDSLPPDARDRYMRLAVFNAEGPVPMAALRVLWGLNQKNTTAFVGELAGKSLLRVEASRVSLHDLQMDYLVRCVAANMSALHSQLLAAYSERCPDGWASGPNDGYFHQHLAHHLHDAGRLSELQALLFDPDWMKAKLATGNMAGLLADYDTLPSDPAACLVGALRLSAHVLADDLAQLASQLTGRLASQDDPQLRDLVQCIRRWRGGPWLRPLTASLTCPGGPLLRILAHDGHVLSLAVSADGRRAVCGERDGGTAQVWDLDTGELVGTLTGHERRVLGVAVSADGRRAVSGGDGGTVRVWDLDTGELVRTLTGHGRRVNSVAVSADGHRAVSGGDGTVRMWDLDTGELVHTLTRQPNRLHEEPVAVSADGRRAVSGGDGGTVRVWDLDTGELVRTLTGDEEEVRSVAVSADGRRAVSGGGHGMFSAGGGTVRVWDLETGELVRVLTGHDSWMIPLALSADGRRAVSAGGGTVRVWDLETGELVRVLTGHDDSPREVAISADGRRVVSGGGATARVWDPDTGEQSHAMTGHDGRVLSVAVSADGRRAISASDDMTVRVWDLDTGETVHSLTRLGRVISVAVSADGRCAISAGSGMVQVWNPDSGELMHSLTGHRYVVWEVAVSADGHRAVSGVDGTVRVWDLDTGEQLHSLTGHDGRVLSVAMSADGRRAISADHRTVRVWDLDTGKRVVSLGQRLWDHPGRRLWDWCAGLFHSNESPQSPLCVGADGRRAVSVDSDRTVRVWDLDSGRKLHTLTSQDGFVREVAVSADGRRAVSGGFGGMVRVWDLNSGELVHTLTGHRGPVTAVAVSADGRRAVSGGDDKTVRVWDLTQGVELTSFVSDSKITAVATTPPGTRVIAGTATGPLHLLELCGRE